jgi:hypothetical protein
MGWHDRRSGNRIRTAAAGRWPGGADESDDGADRASHDAEVCIEATQRQEAWADGLSAQAQTEAR